MKNTIALGLVMLCVAGCTTNRNKMSTGRVASPIIEDVDAHLKVGQAIEGSGKVNTFELLGIHFTGGSGRKVGSVGNGLYVDNKTPWLNPLRLLFGSPGDVNAAIDSAYYDAVDKSNSDGLIVTRVKSQKTGFTLLHIIGWGTATADIKGHEVIIKDGQLPRPSTGPIFIQK